MGRYLPMPIVYKSHSNKNPSYVLLTATGTFFLSIWHAFRVPSFRRKAGIRYPNVYATPEQIDQAPTEDKKLAMYLLNCAQRAHHHFLENYPSVLAALLIAGLKYPVASASLGALWSFGRVLFATGYTRADKKDGTGRYRGGINYIGQLGLYGLVAKTGYDLLMS